MYARFLTSSLFVVLAASAVGCAQYGAATGLPTNYNLPPAQQLMEPGPGVTGPGPGVMPPPPPIGYPPMPAPPAQVLFVKPEGMQIRWDVAAVGQFDSDPLIVPGRTDFGQGGKYYLKITDIEGREGVELYPTLEVGRTTPRTAAYLDHNAIPIQLTNEDFDQVLSGNFVTKVIYLPDPEFQELALAGVDTLVSTRLDPGVDPIVEADRRGAILAIVRIGNKDRQMPQDAGVIQAAYQMQMQMMAGQGPLGPAPVPYSSSAMARTYVAGVTAPHFGMPITGTPIGLPGPPHIPLGGPAGLQQHQIRNHTHVHMPEPTENIWMHVKQSPGFAYPAPANKMYLKEATLHPNHVNRQPPGTMQVGQPPAHPHGSGHRNPAGCGCQQCRTLTEQQ